MTDCIDQTRISDDLNCCNANPSSVWCAFEPAKVLEKLLATIDLVRPVLILIHRTKVDLSEDFLRTVVGECEISAISACALSFLALF